MPRSLTAATLMAATLTAAALSALVLATGMPAAAREFSRSDYIDVTSRKQLPSPVKNSPLAAVARYLATLPFLDRRRMKIEVLLDQDDRRVYRIEHACKSAEACGDDSVAGTREALEVRRGKGGRWAITWVGLQVRCHKGRGHRSWSKARCL